MNKEDWVKNLQKLTEITNEATVKRIEFYQNILVAGAGVLGILVSLHTTQTTCLYIRLVYALSVCLLLLGVLTVAIALQDLSSLPSRCQKAFQEELQRVLREGGEPDYVPVRKKKRTVFCEKLCLISFLLSLFSLVVYTILSLFY